MKRRADRCTEGKPEGISQLEMGVRSMLTQHRTWPLTGSKDLLSIQVGEAGGQHSLGGGALKQTVSRW